MAALSVADLHKGREMDPIVLKATTADFSTQNLLSISLSLS
jgi:hypothetical protein